MEPGPAEVARTLAGGFLPGVAYVHRYPGRLRVGHAAGDGTPLLLTRASGDLAAALLPASGQTDTAVVLRVDDVVPVAGAPWRGRLWLAGWACVLDGEAARAAADEYARVDPTGDLLDVGRGHALYRMAVVDVRLARADRLVEIDLDDFRAAQPDPLQRDEQDLLLDLAAHHAAQLADLVGQLSVRPSRIGWRPVRLDRYSLTLASSRGQRRPQRIRVPFAQPANDVADLDRILHPMLCCGLPGCVHGGGVRRA